MKNLKLVLLSKWKNFPIKQKYLHCFDVFWALILNLVPLPMFMEIIIDQIPSTKRRFYLKDGTVVWDELAKYPLQEDRLQAVLNIGCAVQRWKGGQGAQRWRKRFLRGKHQFCKHISQTPARGQVLAGKIRALWLARIYRGALWLVRISADVRAELMKKAGDGPEHGMVLWWQLMKSMTEPAVA